jgi:hypothetical protein
MSTAPGELDASLVVKEMASQLQKAAAKYQAALQAYRPLLVTAQTMGKTVGEEQVKAVELATGEFRAVLHDSIGYLSKMDPEADGTIVPSLLAKCEEMLSKVE